jgi:hypothetical protein
VSEEEDDGEDVCSETPSLLSYTLIRQFRRGSQRLPGCVTRTDTPVYMREREGGRRDSDFIRLLFLQAHRETDHFFAVSGVQSAQSNLGPTCFHFHLTVVLNQL